MPKHTLSTVKLIRKLLDELKSDGVLQNTAESNEVIDSRLFWHLGDLEDNSKELVPKMVTILLSDIRGFSRIVESHSPADVVNMLNRYFNCMGEIITRYEGTIDKIMGDSMLTVFGLPESREDDAERAIACAVEMQIALNEFNEENKELSLPPVYLGIGINTGSVIAAELGSEHYSEFTVIGSGVNLTSRIESHSLRGQILISENTYELVRDFIEAGEPNFVEVKGARDTIYIYELFATTRPKVLVVPRHEGRKGPRVPANMPVNFQCLSDNTVLSEKHKGQVIDISYNGLQFESSVELGKYSEIKLSFPVNFFDGKAIDIYARIISSHNLGGRYRSSMEFTSIDSDVQVAVRKLVDQLEANSATVI